MTPATVKSHTAEEKQLLDAPEAEYMNADQLAFFRHRLVDLHDSTRERIREAKEEMISPRIWVTPVIAPLGKSRVPC